MSQKNLPGIFALLPEDFQRNALLEALESMFAAGEWGRLDELIPLLVSFYPDGYFRARSISIGVRVASRMRNYELAFARYQLFMELEDNPEIARPRAETLMQLAIQLLPRWPDKLYDLWRKSLTPDMPIQAQEIAAKTGVLLAGAFSRNHVGEMVKAVCEAMQKNLAEDVWRRASNNLAR